MALFCILCSDHIIIKAQVINSVYFLLLYVIHLTLFKLSTNQQRVELFCLEVRPHVIGLDGI